ncbi:MAG: DUF6624 domain-containing protein [Patescibacteria group bacterium]
MNRELAKKIEEMAKEDQKIRHASLMAKSYAKRVKTVDRKNLHEMKEIVKVYGWPTISVVGGSASDLAWLLVQHADSDVQFQKKCLSLMKHHLNKNDVSKKNVAYLIDRIRVNEGKKQIYGTQFYKDRDGTMKPSPIWNIKSIEKRRRKAKLEPFKKYSEVVKKMFN